MSYGYGIGDFIKVIELAWGLYRICKDSPGEFKNLTSELSSMHIVLKEVNDEFSDLSPERQIALGTILDRVKGVFEDVKVHLSKHKSLGTQKKRVRDRFKWGAEPHADLRQRLISNTTLLTNFRMGAIR